uniref:Uncharacterized protein n=1 Tax=viral metagenome TaxID=1070528 RepID=A0A6C0JK24_9ZZZZ
MARRSGNTGNNGGIMGSGIFGMFGTTIQCPASDTSFYCSFMKVFNFLIVFIIVFVILYTIYNVFIAPSKGRRR